MIHMMHMFIASFESKAMMAMMAMDGYGWLWMAVHMILIKAPARRVGWTDLSLLPAGYQPKGPPGTIRSMVFEREQW